MKKGKLTYVPPDVFGELEIIKNNYNMNKQAEAFKKMSKLSKLGMEMEKISGYQFIENKFKRK